MNHLKKWIAHWLSNRYSSFLTIRFIFDKTVEDLFTVNPEINVIILLMRKICVTHTVSLICINNITHLFLTWFEQYFYLLANVFKQLVQQPLRPPPPPLN